MRNRDLKKPRKGITLLLPFLMLILMLVTFPHTRVLVSDGVLGADSMAGLTVPARGGDKTACELPVSGTES